jgi:ABC-type transport system involved in multi-copper enzyme maturation permease subunit
MLDYVVPGTIPGNPEHSELPMYTKLLAITRNTFIETVRQPIFAVLMWVTFGALLINPALVGFTLEAGGKSDAKMAMDIGLATLLLYGLLISVFSATGVITREIEAHTVLTVVSKPVARPVFLLGKYLGVCGAVAVGYYFLCLTLMMTIRHGTMPTASDPWDLPVLVFSGAALLISLVAAVFGNYVYGWHFSTTLTAWVVPLASIALGLVLFVSPKWEIQSPATDFGDLQLPYALLMSFLGVIILAAFAVALAARFSQVVTLLLCAGVYCVGLMSDHYLGQPAEAGGPWLYRLLYGITPNFQFCWAGNALSQSTQDHMIAISLTHVGQVAAYAVLYALGVLGLGVALFETREVS